MKAFITGVLFFIGSVGVYAQVAAKHSLTGTEFHKLEELSQFKGFKYDAGTLIGQATTGNYAFATYSKAGYNVVVFEWCVPGVKPSYTLLDTVNIGYIKPTQTIVYTVCRLNSKSDNYLVALVKNGNGKYLKTIYKAWRANKNTKRLEAISVKGIDCLNDEGED